MSKRRKRQHHYKQSETRAGIYGSSDEKKDVAKNVIAPAAAEIWSDPNFRQLYDYLVKADSERLTPRRGVAMSQIDLGGDADLTMTLERPVGLSFSQLRMVEKQTPIISIIVNRRVRQIQRFLEQPKFTYMPGFELRFRDKTRRIHPEDRERFNFIRQWLNNCGAEFDPRRRRAYQRDTLHEFVNKHIRDSLILDAAPIELINTRLGNVHGFSAVDGAKVFLTDPNMGLEEDFNGPAEFNVLTGRTDYGNPRNIIAVYAQQGRIKAHYTHMDLLYPVRNRTSEEEQFGYGLPEIEGILGVSSAMLNAFTLNARSISDNSIPRGFLTFFGDFQEEDKMMLKATWLAQLKGAENRHRMPFLFAEPQPGSGAQFTPLPGPEEAMYMRWWTLLVAIACAKYQIDPSEIAHESFTSGGMSSLSGSDTEAKLTSSADAGLHTLLTWLASTLNELISLVDPDVEMYWTGLGETKEDDHGREQSTMLFGEVRERHGLSNEGIDSSVLRAPFGVAGQVYMTTVQSAQQKEMMAQQPQGMPGVPMPGQAAPQEGEEIEEDGQEGEKQPEDEDTPHYGDHEGNLWRRMTQQPMIQKAYQTELELWPKRHK